MLRLLSLCGLLAGCSFDHGFLPADATPPDARPTTATLFIGDHIAGKVHRFTLIIGSDPPLPTLTMALAGALSPMVLPATGELLIGEWMNPVIDRFATPLATPTVNGSITGHGLAANISKMALVDDELWVVNPLQSNVVRLAFDSQGVASLVGTLNAPAGRGIVFDRVRRQVYVTQCCGADTILHYAVDPDRNVTEQLALNGNGLNNPHGMVITPWSELLVVNAGSASILRFMIDSEGNLTPNGAITGNELATPIDLALTPWDDLYVTNQANNKVSRFAFNASQAAVPQGSFAVPSAMSLAYVWLAF